MPFTTTFMTELCLYKADGVPLHILPLGDNAEVLVRGMKGKIAQAQRLSMNVAKMKIFVYKENATR